MKRLRTPRASSAHGICVFCASRLGLVLPPLSLTQATQAVASRARPITTTHGPFQSAATATASVADDDTPPAGSSKLDGYHSSSTLTAAEQIERSNRLRLNAERDAVAQRFKGERIWRKNGSTKDSGDGSVQKLGDALRGSSVDQAHTSGQENSNGTQTSQAERKASTRPSSAKPNSQRQPKRVAMPNFMTSANSEPNSTEVSSSGWGAGETETQPLAYGNVVVKHEQSIKDNRNKQAHTQETDKPRQMPPSSEIEALFRRDSAQTSSSTGTSPLGPPQTPFDGPSENLKHEGTYSSGASQSVSEKLSQDRHNWNTYKAMPLDPVDLHIHSSTSDHESTSSWQHLRRRKSASPPSELPEHQQQTAKSQNILDDDWVDRTFQDHLRQRATRRPLPRITAVNATPKGRSEVSATSTADKKCARCGEMGHIARQCTQPFLRQKCYVCGQTGHVAKNCPDKSKYPQNAGTRGSRDRQSFANPFGETAEQNGGRAKASRTGTSFTPFMPRTETESRSIPHQSRVGDTSTGVTVTFTGEELASSQGIGDVEAEERDRRAARRSRWADAEEHLAEAEKSLQRQPQRKNSRRTMRDDEDEDYGARDDFRAKKAARQAERNAKRDIELKEARRRREARKAEATSSINLPEFISVQQLAQALGERYEPFVERLEELGYDDVFPGKILNAETSGMIAMEYNFEPKFDNSTSQEEDRDLRAAPEIADKELLPTRPPVVTIMGHVDHGKTTILDYLRKSSVAAGEAGGITQHIGAFSVPLASSGKTITFLDTPGHAAFLAMRQRGANVTDVVVLVVAADDSVKPQTLEAIKHAKAAGVPMIVAINKIDKEEADIQRCKADLARHGVEIEDFGGETQVVCVSGKTGRGMDELEENVVTLSEILDHRAESEGVVEGWILEATTKRSGRVATVLVRRGTLKPGCIIVAGKTWARVRSLMNEGGQSVREVGPGMPVEVDGWRDQPIAGDEVLQAPSEQKANSVIEYRLEKEEREKIAIDTEAINESRKLEQEKRKREKTAAASHEPEPPSPAADEVEDVSGQMTIPFIIKADVSGSAEAVSAYILSAATPLIAPTILLSSVGGIHESDIELAAAANAHIVAFNLPADAESKSAAAAQGVKVLENNIIYRVLEDVKAVLEDKLPPVVTQKVVGEAEVGASFDIGIGGRRKMKIAGCKVRNGVIGKGSKVRIIRGGEKIYDGMISSLKNVKKDVQEMRKGTECGMGFDEWEGFEVGDQIQTYEVVTEKRKL